MSVYDELVEESVPTLTAMPDAKRLDEPWHWEIRLNYSDAGGPIDLTEAKAQCVVRSTDSDETVTTFTAKAGAGIVTIDASKAAIKAVRKALDAGTCTWSLDLVLADGRDVKIFGPDSFGIVPEFTAPQEVN